MEPAHDDGTAEDSKGPHTERNPSLVSSLSLLSSSSSTSTSSFNSLIDINEFENEADIIINGTDSQLTPTTPQSPVTHEQTDHPLDDDTLLPPTPTHAQTPVSQILDKSFVGYDPSRIPSSVFSRKNTGQEWSVASNESLFSIHMGNNSFSMGTSDLFFPYDPNNYNPQIGLQPPQSQPQPQPPQPQPPQPPPPQMVSDTNQTSFDPANEEETITNPPPQIVVKEEDRVGSLDGDRSSVGTSTTHLSEESGTSSNSFVFPLLLGGEVANNTKTSEVVPPSSKATSPSPPVPSPPPERTVSLRKEEKEEVEKSKSGQETPEAAPSGGHEEAPENKTWLSYFSCFSFCPINSWHFCWPNRLSNEKKGNETESKN
ncbi:ras guanine nucleotide exchange factor L-like [Impatiens glandulifera]|uniref:ras guanine nucleotide exchange factor L-like n=1 Tax=Impatiens glandulifera TaxID=253017 RepID=UPI001FB12142|nr:ras guanine nucleotide exchange factor L-like [Impatiens glandulifera]